MVYFLGILSIYSTFYRFMKKILSPMTFVVVALFLVFSPGQVNATTVRSDNQQLTHLLTQVVELLQTQLAILHGDSKVQQPINVSGKYVPFESGISSYIRVTQSGNEIAVTGHTEYANLVGDINSGDLNATTTISQDGSARIDLSLDENYSPSCHLYLLFFHQSSDKDMPPYENGDINSLRVVQTNSGTACGFGNNVSFDLGMESYEKQHIDEAQTEPISAIPMENCGITPYKGSAHNVDVSIETDIRGGVQCQFSINMDLPEYSFRLISDPQKNIITKIEVVRGDESTPNQTLIVPESMEPPYRDAGFFAAEDVNSDGYKDIKLLMWWGVTGNKGYQYWLFDPSKNIFVMDKKYQ